jgi:hypothetical protein
MIFCVEENDAIVEGIIDNFIINLGDTGFDYALRAAIHTKKLVILLRPFHILPN